MGMAELRREVQEMYRQVESAGKAQRVKVQGKSAVIEGKPYPLEVAVPIHVRDGKKVWVHVSDNKAVVIGE